MTLQRELDTRTSLCTLSTCLHQPSTSCCRWYDLQLDMLRSMLCLPYIHAFAYSVGRLWTVPSVYPVSGRAAAVKLPCQQRAGGPVTHHEHVGAGSARFQGHRGGGAVRGGHLPQLLAGNIPGHHAQQVQEVLLQHQVHFLHRV